MALVPIPAGTKGPQTHGWNTEAAAIRTEEQAAAMSSPGVGLAHRWCRTCAIDVDDVQTAHEWLAAHGINLTELLSADDAVQVRSPKPNRAKLIYRLPAGVDWLPTIQLNADAGLELRCATSDGTKTMQDVLPPSLHPEFDKPYQWGGLGDWHALPSLPAPMLDLWRGLTARDRSTTAPKGQRPAGVIPPKQEAELVSALACIPPGDRDDWLRVGMALHSTEASNAYGLWCNWSQRSDKFDATDQARVWESFNGHTGPAVHLGTVFAMAAERGWINPASKRATVEQHDDTAATDDAQPWQPAHDPNTHLANANRLKSHFGDRLLYVEGIGWHTWGPPWRHDDLGARAIAAKLGQIIASEAGAMGPWVAAADREQQDQRKGAMDARFKWARQSEQAQTIAQSLSLAEPLFACKADQLDANPDLLGLPDGVLDLRTCEARPHHQRDLITKVAGVDYNPSATAPTWRTFLDFTTNGDVELLAYLQELTGYALSGHRGDHLLPIAWGSGANGKSTFLGALQAMLGDYASTAAPGLLIQRNSTEHPTGLADLQGRRLVVVSETGEAGRLNEEQVKALTGGDLITARRMRMDFYTFKPTHLLTLQTNHRPRVAGTDEGIWRRLRLLPFSRIVPADQRDPRLPEKLRAELPGILAWAVEGWRRYQKRGAFITPASVTAATAEYRDASDMVGAFIAEECVTLPGVTASAGDLYKAFVTWCEEAGERPRSQRDFGMRLTDRGLVKWKGTGGVIRWRGIGLAADESGRSGPCGPTSGLVPTRGNSYSDQPESWSASSASSASDDYRRGKDGDS